jgi:hypothetical protein
VIIEEYLGVELGMFGLVKVVVKLGGSYVDKHYN